MAKLEQETAGVAAFYEEEGATVSRYADATYWDQRYHRLRFRHVRALLQDVLTSGDLFLDVGCGTGEYLDVAESLSARPVGVDLSFSYLRRVKERGHTDVARADARLLPYGDSAFDVVLCSEVVEHLPDPAVGIRELCRVASRAVVISTPNDGLMRRWGKRLLPGQTKALDAAVGHISVMSVDGLKIATAMPGWRLSVLQTKHILPPVIMQKLRLPPALSALAGLVERMLAVLRPNDGNATLLVLKRDQPAPASQIPAGAAGLEPGAG